MKIIRFAENLKMLRIDKKLTQKELAALPDADRRTVSAWEKGVCEPNFSALAALCDIFDETFDGILT